MKSPIALIQGLICLIFMTTTELAKAHNSFFDLFQMAESTNYQLQAAHYNTQASKAGLNAAQASFLPSVSLGSNISYIDKNDEVLGMKTEDQIWNKNWAQLTISIPIFSKALRQLHLLKEMQHKMTFVSEELARKSFYSAYVELYGSLVLLETNRLIQQSNVNFYKDILEGDIANMDPNDPIRIQIELTYHNTNIGFQNFLSGYHQLKAQFLAITGIEELEGMYGLPHDFMITDVYQAPPKEKAERKKFIEQLCEKATATPLSEGNLQFKLASLQLEQAEALYRNSKLWDVNVFAQASYGISQIDMNSIGATIDSNSWNATIGVTIPLLDLTHQHRKRESFYQKLSAQSNLREANRQLKVQAQTILAGLDSAYAIHDAFYKKVNERSLNELIQTQYKRFEDALKGPNSSVTSVLAEVGSLQLSFQASLQISNAIKDIIVGHLKLKLFTGEISEQDIQELSGYLSLYTLLPEYQTKNDSDATE